jgi:flagellar FliL protein
VVSDTEADAAEAEIDLDGDFEPEKKKFSGKKIVLFFVLPILLLGGGGAGVLFSGILGGEEQEKKVVANSEAAGEGPVAPPKTVFFDLPEMLVNLNSSGRRPSFLKMRVSLELTSDADALLLKNLSPRIIDNFQVYLRELRAEDLRGSAGIYRLREELLARVNAAVRPAKVKDVLFKDMLVQ